MQHQKNPPPLLIAVHELSQVALTEDIIAGMKQVREELVFLCLDPHSHPLPTSNSWHFLSSIKFGEMGNIQGEGREH